MKEKIRALRESRQMTQRDLAERLDVAVQSVSKWELGITQPRLPMLRKIASIFNVDMNYFSDIVPPSETYYHDKEVAALAQEMFEDPDRRVLFDASRGLSKESLEEVKKFIDYQKAKEGKMF